MRKSITFSADEALVEKARAKARAGNKELEDEMRRWLEDYARDVALIAEEGDGRAAAYREVMDKLSHISTGGRKFTRERSAAPIWFQAEPIISCSRAVWVMSVSPISQP